MTRKLAVLCLFAALLLTLNPALDRPVFKPAPDIPDYAPLRQEICHYLAQQPGVYGFYFIDLNSGQEWGYNALVPFHAASTFKLPMNLYLYREAARGNLHLEEELLFMDKHLEGGTGILKDRPPGSRHTMAELAVYSVVHSDNVATNILLERLGRDRVKDFMRSLGAQVVDDDANITCPYDLALYMRETLDFARSRVPHGHLLLNSLFDARYKDRLPAPLPEGTRTANKVGTWPPEYTYHDVAYVVHPRRPYILVLTSRDTPGYGETLPVFHHVSRMVYQYQTEVGQLAAQH